MYQNRQGDLRLDGIRNDLTGFGTSHDKATYSYYGSFRRLQDQELSDLYHSNSLAARIADALPEECFRPGYTVDTGDQGSAEWLAEKHRDLDVVGRFSEGARWGRVFGSGFVLLGAEDGREANEPLNPKRIDSVVSLLVVDGRYVQPATWYGVSSAKFGQVETYRISPIVGDQSAQTSYVHESRLIAFGGAPTAPQERAQLGGRDFSVLQKPYETLIRHDTTWRAIEVLIQDSHQAVYSMSGLAEALAAGEGEILKERMRAMDMARSTIRALVIDAGDDISEGESFERMQTSFTDLPALLDRVLINLASAAGIPATLLLGQSPAGLNATGESDLNNWFDRVRWYQNGEMGRAMRKLDEVLLASAEGAKKGKATQHRVTWGNLWRSTPLEEAQRRQALATADAAYVTAGVLLPEEVALARFGGDGFGDDIILTDEAKATREELLSSNDSSAVPTGEADQTGIVETEAGTPIELAPTTISKLLSANEARKLLGQGPALLPDGSQDPDGNLPIDSYAAAKTAAVAPPAPAPF